MGGKISAFYPYKLDREKAAVERSKAVEVPGVLPVDLTTRLARAVELGATGLIYDGMRYVLENGVLITVVPVKSANQKRRRKRRSARGEAAAEFGAVAQSSQ